MLRALVFAELIKNSLLVRWFISIAIKQSTQSVSVTNGAELYQRLEKALIKVGSDNV
jgi:hypothetical protein